LRQAAFSTYDDVMGDSANQPRPIRERLDELFRRLRAPRAGSADFGSDGVRAMNNPALTDLKDLRDGLAAEANVDHPVDSATPMLSLVVLQSRDVEKAKDFYSLLGLSFVEEQHGKGPRHYSSILGALVLEIYPCQGDGQPAPLRIGFRVPRLDQILNTMRCGGVPIVRELKDSPWGRRGVVEDPDGNRVELAALDQALFPEKSD
jgi:lactoylglutathione lyase